MKPLAVCAVFKNEAPFLLEWIAYHRAIGFDHVVLYDNDSSDGGTDLIRSSWAAACTTVLHWPRRPAQLPAYRHCIYNLSSAFSWIAFIDLDEFLLPFDAPDIGSVLQRAEGHSAMLVNWRVFGPSGWTERPDGLVIENYDTRAPDELPVNGHVKSIVRCSDLLDATDNPHVFAVSGTVCDPAGRMVENIAIQPVACHQHLVLNHYVTRSRADWIAKIHRGSAVIEYKALKYREDLFDHYVAISEIRDEAIKRHIPAVLALLSAPPTRGGPAPPEAGPLLVAAHIHLVGDVDLRLGDWIGRRGSGRWIEGICLTPTGSLAPEDIAYCATLRSDMQTRWVNGGTYCGTRGLGVPVTGFAVRLSGEASAHYTCHYTATFIDGSTAGPVQAEQDCTAATGSPLEALKITLRPRRK